MADGSNKHVFMGNRLRDIRNYLGENQTIFGARFGLKRHDIANYERGRADLPSSVMGGLDRLGFSITWLLTGEGGMFRTGKSGYGDLVFVNRYDHYIGSEQGTFVVGENAVGSVAFRKDWIKGRGLNSKDLALVDVVGDSMEKVLREGDFVLIDITQTEIVSGKAYVIRIGDELLVKYLQHLPGGFIQVFSENSTIYPSFTVSKGDLGTDIFIIGRVVASAHMW